jgi:hypothetical protein
MAKKSKSSRSSRRSSSRKMKHTRKHKSHHKRKTHRRGGAYALNGAPVGYHLSGDWSSKMSLGQGADYFKYHEGQHGGGSLGMGRFPDVLQDSALLPAALRGPAHIGGIDKAIADVRGLSDAPNSTTTVGGRRRNRSRRNKSYGGNRRNRSRRNKSCGGRRRKNNTYTVTIAEAKAAANAVANATKANTKAVNEVKNATKANTNAVNATKEATKANTNAVNAVKNANVVTNAAATNAPATTGGRNRRSHRRSYRRGGSLGYAPFPSSGMLLNSPTAYAQAGLNPEWKTDVAFTDAKIRETQ